MVHSKRAFIAGAAIAGLLVFGLSACGSKSASEQNENAAASPAIAREDSFPPPDTMPIPSPSDTTRHPR